MMEYVYFCVKQHDVWVGMSQNYGPLIAILLSLAIPHEPQSRL